MGFVHAPPVDVQYLGALPKEKRKRCTKPSKALDGRTASKTSKRPPSFLLLEPLVWEHNDGTVEEVAAGFVTDFASVPRFLWGLIASYGKQTLPAILHDSMCWHATTLAERRAADDLFRVTLQDQGVANVRAALMWAGVGLATAVDCTLTDWKLWRAVAYIAQLAIGVVTLWGAVFMPIFLSSLLPWNLLFVLLLFVPFPIAAIWGPGAWQLRAGTYLFALFVPLLLVSWAISFVFWVLSCIVWRLHGGEGPPPTANPTVNGL